MAESSFFWRPGPQSELFEAANDFSMQANSGPPAICTLLDPYPHRGEKRIELNIAVALKGAVQTLSKKLYSCPPSSIFR